MRIIIATSKVPADFPQFCTLVRDYAEENGITIPSGILFTDGAGCANVAMELVGNNVEQFANTLTMVLMPARWAETGDELPETDTITI